MQVYIDTYVGARVQYKISKCEYSFSRQIIQFGSD